MTTSQPASQPQKHIFVFDQARSCSNLLGKLFSAHQNLQYERHPFQLAMTRGPERLEMPVSEKTMARLMQQAAKVPTELAEKWGAVTFEQSWEHLRTVLQGAEKEGKRAWISEHACYCMRKDFALSSLRSQKDGLPSADTNPTHMPRDILHKVQPLILIRHPALTTPSFHRVQRQEQMLELGDEAFDYWLHLQYSQFIYAYFQTLHAADPVTWAIPVVVDAEDVVHRTTALTAKLCEVLGIVEEGVRVNWAVSGVEEKVVDGVAPGFLDKLRRSTGIEGGNEAVRDADIDIDAAESTWRDEFGADDASALRARVDAQMPVYWWLRAFKLDV